MAAPWPRFEAARAEEAARVDAVEEYLRGATRARTLPRARTLSPAAGVASARAAPKVRFADPVFVEPPPGSAGRALVVPFLGSGLPVRQRARSLSPAAASAPLQHRFGPNINSPPKKVCVPWLETDAPGFRMIPYSEFSRDPMPVNVDKLPQGLITGETLVSGRASRQARARGRKGPRPVAGEPMKLRPMTAPATEEDWARRLHHRVNGVAAVKNTDDYRTVWLSGMPRPVSPDPALRTAKRDWERDMQNWRDCLKELSTRASPPRCSL